MHKHLVKKLPFERQMKANESAWNEVIPIHQSHREGQEEYFRNRGCLLDETERKRLPDLKDKNVAHLCCNCGQDTLSLVNLGANCTGFDLSLEAIKEARRLSENSGVKADFVHSNVLDIPEAYFGRFDLVYISRGALVWIPDLKLLMKNVSALLKPGGELFLYDQHPFTHILDETQKGLSVMHDYFEESPDEYYGLDYVGNTVYKAKPNYQFMVRLSDLLNGMTFNGLRIIEFLEFEHSMFQQFPEMTKREDGLFYLPKDSGVPRIPLMMLVRAVKE